MHRRIFWAGGLVLGLGLVLLGRPAHAFVTRLTPLSDMQQMNFLLVARVEALPQDRPALVLAVGEQLKGKFPFPKLVINMTGDADGKKLAHPAQLRKRLATGSPVVLFVNQRSGRYTVFAFTNGTWFQVIGRKASDSEPVRWAFTHCEPYLRRTFAGTTAELRGIISDALAGKKKPPAPNPKEKPGLGPEIKSGEQRTPKGTEGPRGALGLGRSHFPLAVIPTLGLGGPLAVLALLFPGLFGGALLVLRNWMALLTVASVNSTLLFVYLWFGRSLAPTWLGTPQGLWFTMILVTLAGILWAWRRHLKALQNGQDSVPKPTRSEQVILWIASLALLGSFFFCWFGELAPDDPSWKLLLVLTIGFWTGTVAMIYHRFLRRPGAASRPQLPTEGIVLWSILVASTCLAATWPAAAGAIQAKVEGSGVQPVQQRWVFIPRDRPGSIVSTCLVHGDRVFVAAAHKQGLEAYGVLYCLDAHNRERIWEFDDGGDLKQVFSTPCFADGRLYMGEGFHEDKNCRLLCLDAARGKKLWEFQTESHVESSPCVVGDRVFVGAGDDGVYCLKAKTSNPKGEKLWQYPGETGDTRPTAGKVPAGKTRLKLHVDASPAVVGDRLYVGSGVDRDADDPGDPAVFCLDARTGKKLWLVSLGRALPAWGSPVVAGDQVFFGLGNGDIYNDDKEPAGALLCLDARTGKELWRYKLPNGVLKQPAVDKQHVYFACRDGLCYCLNRKDGQIVWKAGIKSPGVAAPALVRCEHCGTARLYVAGSGGRFVCLDPDTGAQVWALDLGVETHLFSNPVVAVDRTAGGERRRIYFGAGLKKSTQPAVFCLEDQ